jgi:membrane-bound inhibitor of C-type lysozyme
LLRLWAVTSAAWFACACADGGSSAREARYACEDGASLSVRFSADGNEAAIERPRQESLVLPRRAAASGFLYETSQYTLRGKGDEAMWPVGRHADAMPRQLLTAPAVSPPTM